MISTATKVPFEITLIAYIRWQDGVMSLFDIADTSHRNAPSFVRRWLRDPQVVALAAFRPGEVYNPDKIRVVRPTEPAHKRSWLCWLEDAENLFGGGLEDLTLEAGHAAFKAGISPTEFAQARV